VKTLVPAGTITPIEVTALATIGSEAQKKTQTLHCRDTPTDNLKSTTKTPLQTAKHAMNNHQKQRELLTYPN